MLVRSKVPLAEPALESARQDICSALGLSAEDFYVSGPLLHVPNSSEGPIPVHDNAGFWYNLNIWRSYYGPGYERGDLPLLVKCAEWLDKRFPGCEIWYGHDVNDENLRLFDSAARAELMRYYSQAPQRRSVLKYPEAKQVFIDGLRRDVDAHEAGRFEEIGAGFEHADAGLPRGQGPEFDKLSIALDFWDGWIDSRNHNWRYYDPIAQRDWPVLARRIITSLEADEEISDPMVLAHFDSRARQSSKGPIQRLLERLWK